MKTTQILTYLLTFCFIFCFSCSKDSIDEQKEEEVIRCFVVKEKDTNILISNAEISLKYWVCGGGCSFAPIGTDLTDQNGQSCFNMYSIKESYPGAVTVVIYCLKEGYKPFERWDIPADFSEIYLEPNL